MTRRRYLIATAVAAFTVATLAAAMPVANAGTQRVVVKLTRNTIQAPESPEHAAGGSDACTAPSPDPSGSVKTTGEFSQYAYRLKPPRSPIGSVDVHLPSQHAKYRAPW